MKKSFNKFDSFDPSFYILANELSRAIEKNKEDGTDQKEQVEELMDAEAKFKITILSYRQASEIYKKFLQKICIQNGNILSARPYFREIASTFSKKITPAIKDRDIQVLQTFNINYQFVKFIRDSWLGPFPKRAEQLFNRIHIARTKLIENNMPLAINTAKIFYRKTPKSHLSLIDMIGISALGLAKGIDKWTGTYSPVFRSVCIGRMKGDLIDAYGETALHFYPSDVRILYKANSIRGRRGIDNIEELTEAVRQSFIDDEKEGKSVPKKLVTMAELQSLMNAASTISSDAVTDEEGFGVYHFTADPTPDMSIMLERKETLSEVLTLAKDLSILQKKVLRLKGVKI